MTKPTDQQLTVLRQMKTGELFRSVPGAATEICEQCERKGGLYSAVGGYFLSSAGKAVLKEWPS